jgi:heavy metal sensor kinase
MIAQARRISAQYLESRLDVPGTGDELEHLATTFNGMLDRLDRAFKRLRQFSAATSHELRTPLTIMKGELEVALRRPRDVEEYQRVLRTQLEALNEFTRTVEELLTLARSESGAGAVDWRPVELGTLARRVCQARRPLADSKGVRVEVEAHEAVWVRGEGRLLERVLSNLLDNALRHTPERGRVTIRTGVENEGAVVVVRDTGPGIPPEELPRLFDRFFSRSAASARGFVGGLGLGLCRWIAEVHLGRIEASSPPGGGAAFSVFLPLSVPPASN